MQQDFQHFVSMFMVCIFDSLIICPGYHFPFYLFPIFYTFPLLFNFFFLLSLPSPYIFSLSSHQTSIFLPPTSHFLFPNLPRSPPVPPTPFFSLYSIVTSYFSVNISWILSNVEDDTSLTVSN